MAKQMGKQEYPAKIYKVRHASSPIQGADGLRDVVRVFFFLVALMVIYMGIWIWEFSTWKKEDSTSTGGRS